MVAAGTSDAPVAAEAALTARVYGAGVDVDHRRRGGRAAPRARRSASELAGADCLIVVAGMEGALPSVVGGLVGVPLVAVPTSVGYGASFGGLAALLAMLNSCAPGVTRREHRQRVRRRRVRGPGRPQRRTAGPRVIGWVDASSGASGDMLLGALLDAGVPLAVLEQAASSRRARATIALAAEDVSAARLRRHPRATSRSPTPTTHRTWADVRALLDDGRAADRPSATARTRRSSGSPRPRRAVHGTSPDEVHFHEVGALDAIADVVGVCAGLVHLGLDALVVSPVAVGGRARSTARTARCRCRRRRWSSCCAACRRTPGPVRAELCTPTGAALLDHLRHVVRARSRR